VRRDRNCEAKKSYHQLEIHFGLFERVIPLPRNILGEDAKGSYTDGFLIVTIPKCEEPVEHTEIVRLQI
jgi:HSP20 family protein